MNYTEEERNTALQTSLSGIARLLGYTPIKKGRYYFLEEMDSVMIKDDRTWCRFSRINAGVSDGRGGTQIDFMMQFGDCASVPEAIHKILEMNNIYVLHAESYEKFNTVAEFRLPDAVEGKYSRLYAYLCKTRMLSADVVSYFVHELKILYESREHHNLVFLGKDREGKVKYAMQRGTCDMYGRSFKNDIIGSNKNYGVNVINERSDTVKVFESCIDCMSYIDIYGDYDSNKVILGMLADKPLMTFLKEHNNVKQIEFCLDNDEPARIAVLGLPEQNRGGYKNKYEAMGYMVTDSPAAPYGKDYNENLKYYRKNSWKMGNLKNSCKGR